jgi:hypothetical protein
VVAVALKTLLTQVVLVVLGVAVKDLEIMALLLLELLIEAAVVVVAEPLTQNQVVQES